MRYRGFEITACSDSGIERYNRAESRDELCSGFFCEVYPAGDEQYANQLDTFCLAEDYEIPDTSEESLADGIIRYVDKNYYALLESKNEAKQKRTEELVGRLVCWLGETENGAELYDTLSQTIGMTDEEIREVGFCSLAPFFEREQYAQTIADWLIDNGTENSFSGSWIVHHEEITERFGVNLKTDEELRNMVSRHLYNSSDIVADFCMDADKVDLDFFLAYCPYAHKHSPQEKAEQAEKEENELLAAEDAMQTSIYLANAPDCCSGTEQLGNVLGMLGADVMDEDVYHDEDEHPKMSM